MFCEAVRSLPRAVTMSDQNLMVWVGGNTTRANTCKRASALPRVDGCCASSSVAGTILGFCSVRLADCQTPSVSKTSTAVCVCARHADLGGLRGHDAVVGARTRAATRLHRKHLFRQGLRGCTRYILHDCLMLSVLKLVCQ